VFERFTAAYVVVGVVSCRRSNVGNSVTWRCENRAGPYFKSPKQPDECNNIITFILKTKITILKNHRRRRHLCARQFDAIDPILNSYKNRRSALTQLPAQASYILVKCPLTPLEGLFKFNIIL